MTEKLEGASRRVRASIGERGMVRVLGVPVGLALAVLGVGIVILGGGSPGSRVPAAEASHAVVPLATLEALPNGSKVLLCHTEGNGTQHSVESSVASVISAGHFSASGAPLHFAGDAHDFLINYTIKGGPGEDDQVVVVNPDTCGGALATETPTSTAVPPTNTPPVATSTAAITPDPTNTAVPPTSTPTVPVATSTAAITPEPTNTPTRTPTNTSVPQATNTPVPTATRQPVVVPPTNTPVPLVAQVQSVQATPRPPVRALPSTGSGGYESSSMNLLAGLALILTGSTLALAAMRRRAQ